MAEAAVLQTENRRFDSFPSYHLCGGASARLGLISLDRPERYRPPLPFMPLAVIRIACLSGFRILTGKQGHHVS